MENYVSCNPATEETVEIFPVANNREIDLALNAASAAGREWRSTSLTVREDAARRLGVIFESRRAALASVISQEMGKPITQAEIEADRCIQWPALFAGITEQALASHRLSEVAERRVIVSYEALGVLLTILPWNFPASLAIRAAVPALLAGNAVIIKPAPNTPRTARMVEDVFREAGFPASLFQVLFLSNEAARRVILDSRVQMVSFTGSVEAGRRVAAIAGEGLKRITLELGGSDPFVVLPDADVSQAVDIAIRARMSNAGQVCCSPKRFIVHRDVAKAFIEGVSAKISALKVGDPSDRSVQMGPLARRDLCDRLADQVSRTLQGGARVVARSECPSGKGYYHAAMVVAGVPRTAPAACEELFGPVFPVFEFEREEEAIALANATQFGLGACVVGQDTSRMERCAQAIGAGVVALNGSVGVDPRIPFGGIRDSGFGRACGIEGLREVSNVKAVVGG